jgi:hypothetical protein
MTDFHRDNAWQRTVRDAVLVPGFYERFFPKRYALIDGNDEASRSLQVCGIDTVVSLGGALMFVEEKIVRFKIDRGPYTAFAIETESCTVDGRKSDGWIKKTSLTDRLLYCFATREERPDLDCYWLGFAALQAWFIPREENYPRFGPLPTLNKSAGRVVPIDDVLTAIGGRLLTVKAQQRED